MKQKFLYILFLTIGLTTYALKTLDATLKKYNKNDVPYISVTELQMLQSQRNVVILDSREKNEFDVSHISSATFVGYNNFSIDKVIEKIKDKDTPIVVYCTIGIRSEVIGNKLQKAGFTNIKNLYGGICEWKNTDYIVIDSTNIETENVHTFSKQWSKWLKKGTVVYE